MKVNPSCKEFELTVSEQLRQPMDKLLKIRDQNFEKIKLQSWRLQSVYKAAEARRVEIIELNREVGRVGK